MDPSRVDEGDWVFEDEADQGDWEFDPNFIEKKSPEDFKQMSLLDRGKYLLEREKQWERRAGVPLIKGAASGATLGLSQKIPGLEKKESEQGGEFETGEFVGSFAPIAKLYNWGSKAALYLASKSPILGKQLTSMANLTGAFIGGATYEAGKQIVDGKGITPDDILLHGTEWAALDAGLSALGYTGRFAKNVLAKAKSSKEPPTKIVNNLVERMKQDGVDFSSPEKVSNAAFDILSNEPEIATRAVKAAEQQVPEHVAATERAAAGVKTRPVAKTMKEVKELAKISLEAKKGELLNNVKPQDIKSNLARTVQAAKPYAPEAIEFNKTAEEILKQNVERDIATHGEKAPTKKELGETVKRDIEEAFELEEAVYQPMYEAVEKGAERINHSYKKPIEKLSKMVRTLQSVKTQPEGYKKVITTIENVLEDIGMINLPKPKSGILKDIHGHPIETAARSITEEIPVSKAMEVARRLGKIADFDPDAKPIKKLLKSVIRDLKEESKLALGKENPDLRKLYTEAEKLYGNTAQKFSTHGVADARYAKSPEKTAQDVLSPTVLEHLKSVLSPKKMEAVEREILEEMQLMRYDKANKTARELSPYLSPRARQTANRIAESKTPNKATRSDRLNQAITSDLQNSIATGTRPETALKIWRTREGQEAVKNAVKGAKNKAEILDYLEQQSFYDFASSVVSKDGKVDFTKLHKFTSDPATRENLRLIGGENTVRFFDNLGHIRENLALRKQLFENIPMDQQAKLGKEILNRFSNRVSKLPKEQQVALEKLKSKVDKATDYGLQRLKKMARTESPIKFKIDDFLESIGATGHSAILLLGALKLGIPHTAAAYGIYRMLYKIASKRSFQNAIRKAADAPKSDPSKFFTLLEGLNESED